ncbi:unnamed protein product [Spirodela intermedia]|uniref:Uncharacterized protein n=1 Tax=Spirodela intermedia TaxID=51605 RepID=A0A7I8L0T8_SPIIN|nr:unnamed protein product [Spirodela intermedia]
MARRCSHCSNNGHNSRTCPARAGVSGGSVGGGGVMLFGVRISEGGFMKKSASMGNISHCSSSSASPQAFTNPGSPTNDPLRDSGPGSSGYASDDPNQASCSSSRSERKKGVPWTEEEHRMFLMGLRRLGKGDWRGIARNFVVSRTPTQVASHAQKYFIRQSNSTRRKRRSSLFDMVPDLHIDQAPLPEEHAQCFTTGKPENPNAAPMQHLSPEQDTAQPELASCNPPEEVRGDVQRSNLPPMIPGFFPAYVPIPLSLWPSSAVAAEKEQVMWEAHEILKPTPFLPKDPANVDQLVRMSDLSLGDASAGRTEPSALSLELLGSSPRQSAFHVNAAVKAPALSQNNDNVVHAL